jgi:hypothetical protein
MGRFDINENVREALLKMRDFYETYWVKCCYKDVILTGSLANYNWWKSILQIIFAPCLNFEDILMRI